MGVLPLIFTLSPLLFIFIAVPLILTALNILHLFSKNGENAKGAPILTLFLGPAFMVLLGGIWGFLPWYEPVVIGHDPTYHFPISPDRFPTFIILSLIAIAGYLVLLYFSNKLPPLAEAFAISAVYLGMILAIFIIIQLSPRIFSYSSFFGDVALMCLFPVNYIILAVPLLRRVFREISRELSACPRNAFTRLSIKLTRSSFIYPIGSLLLLFPLVGIAAVILLLFNQPIDSSVKMFTETSDWLLSTKISPPPVAYEGHYLCTVAARGHRRLVKPLRPGVRRGMPITVNRQLAAANAFEELIAERAPRFHRFVRGTYDRIGFPLATLIKRPITADLVYILMKPFEYLFVITLYFFDRDPEGRIAKQYRK